MSKSALALLALACLSLPAAAQGVRVTLTSGRSLEGELEAFEHGRYRLRLPGGATREIEDREVREIVLIDRPGAERREELPPAEAARSAFERGDYESALRRTAEALSRLEGERSSLGELSRRAAFALVEKALDRRDAGLLADHLRVLVPALPEESRRALVGQLALRFGELHRAAPGDAFTAAFAETLARLADGGTLSPELRAPLAAMFADLAKDARTRKNPAAAVALFQGALKVEPSRREELKAPLLEALLELGARRLEMGDPAGALQAAADADGLAPDLVPVKRLLEDARLAHVKQEIDADYGADAPRLLREFIRSTRNPEHRAWAEQALARSPGSSDPRSPEVAAQMRKYFPVKVGRWSVYRRADGEIHEKIRTDAVVRQADVLRVFCTLEERYRDYSTKKAYTVEIERDAVRLDTASGRETLLRFPLREGDEWSWTVRDREYRRRIRSIGDAVRTGSGAAERTWTDCLVVEFESTLDREGRPVTVTSRSSYAPGMGLVKLEFLDPEFRRFGLDLVEHGQD